MSQVAKKLYRLLHRVQCNSRREQIPLVGIVGYNVPPQLNIQPHIVGAFRGPPVEDVAKTAQMSSEGFRALRQAQQQLQVLKDSEEETREALRCWFQLCQSWGVRTRGEAALRHPTFTSHANRTFDTASTNDVTNSTSSTDAISGSSSFASGSNYDPGSSDSGGPKPDLLTRMAQLAAAMEEGSLLVERLYDANHLTLEEFDDDDGNDEGKEEEDKDRIPDNEQERRGNAAGETGDDSDTARRLLLPYIGKVAYCNQGMGWELLPAPLRTDHMAVVRKQLDELAALVMSEHKELFKPAPSCSSNGCDGAGGGHSGGVGGSQGDHSSSSDSDSGALGTGGAGDLLRRQLEAISQVLFQRLRFRHDPVEWVYDGLAPALLPQVLRRRRGTPLSLAALYCCVARRLGLATAPVKATGRQAPAVAEGPASLHGLPPEVVARQAGRTLALAPPMDVWLVAAAAAGRKNSTTSGNCTAGPSAQAEGGELLLCVDVDRRGRVLTAAEARRRYTDLAAAPLPQLLPSGPPELWSQLARQLATAHMRRGESDLVAYWLVQVLALDHRSPEWSVMAAR